MARPITTTEAAFLAEYEARTGVKLNGIRREGVCRIVEYGIRNGYSTEEIAYNLGTARHEAAGWYHPIREGATRYGPDYTDEQSRRAVKSLKDRGIIRTNYALPINGRSYYGRGLVQITWLDNYSKFQKALGVPLVDNPDLALEWDHALAIMYIGINKGMFTGKKFSDYEFTTAGLRAARAVVNGDVKTNGPYVASYTIAAYSALKVWDTELRRSYAPKIDFGALFRTFSNMLRGFRK